MASKTHGVVTRSQLLDAGITQAEIKWRIKVGLLLRIHRGVYRVGHQAPSLLAQYIAAVLACGEGALLCRRSAAYLHCLIRGDPPPPEVAAPTNRRVKRVKTWRTKREDATVWRGIPVTTVPRTLVDLAPYLTENDLARAFHEAGVRYGTTPEQVEAVLARRPNSPDAPKIRRVLYGDVKVTLSRLEDGFLDRLRDIGRPLPQTNRRVGRHMVDCRWPEHRLTVELDSYRYHRSRHTWEQDRRREREAYARGDDFRRYTYGDVFEDPWSMLAELRDLLPCAHARNRS